MGTQQFVWDLGLSPKQGKSWVPWKVDGQVAGFLTNFEKGFNLASATVLPILLARPNVPGVLHCVDTHTGPSCCAANAACERSVRTQRVEVIHTGDGAWCI